MAHKPCACGIMPEKILCGYDGENGVLEVWAPCSLRCGWKCGVTVSHMVCPSVYQEIAEQAWDEARRSPAQEQIDELARFILEEVPGEPSRSEGAVDTAIRMFRQGMSPRRAPTQSSMEIAARVWQDQDMTSVTMDSAAALEIAAILDYVRGRQKGGGDEVGTADVASAGMHSSGRRGEGGPGASGVSQGHGGGDFAGPGDVRG